ncbi:MAG: SigE family RNA polymerase sigma factor, partial [Micrococcales bacterium]|nr:SigE family RNA polymerase sigma factor [Micrococcales bacterium]
MTRDEGDGFAEFVAARWPELEAVALVALLDAERAREVTTAALAALRGRWSGVVEEGAPTPAARRELVGRLVEA